MATHPDTITWGQMCRALERKITAPFVRAVFRLASECDRSGMEDALLTLCHVIDSFEASTCDQRTRFIDGELDPQQAHAFRRHLGVCDECGGELANDFMLSTRLASMGDDHDA